jgi:hypothetical protein
MLDDDADQEKRKEKNISRWEKEKEHMTGDDFHSLD